MVAHLNYTDTISKKEEARKAMYQPRRTLSQMHIMIYTRFKRKDTTYTLWQFCLWDVSKTIDNCHCGNIWFRRHSCINFQVFNTTNCLGHCRVLSGTHKNELVPILLQ